MYTVQCPPSEAEHTAGSPGFPQILGPVCTLQLPRPRIPSLQTSIRCKYCADATHKLRRTTPWGVQVLYLMHRVQESFASLQMDILQMILNVDCQRRRAKWSTMLVPTGSGRLNTLTRRRNERTQPYQGDQTQSNLLRQASSNIGFRRPS